jgi:hypothetical protein
LPSAVEAKRRGYESLLNLNSLFLKRKKTPLGQLRLFAEGVFHDIA